MNIFEIKVEGNKDSIGGGGRYDDLVGKYLNRKIPAIGISFGLERLTKLANIEPVRTKVTLISLNQDKETIKLAKKLRNLEISCNTMFGKPGKALDYTNSLEIPYAIFIGEEEIKDKKFKLKEMSSGNEKLLTEKQLLNKLRK